MPITEQIRRRFTIWLLVIFYALAIYKAFNGLWMIQLKPHFFTIPFDGTAWMVMSTGIHLWLTDNPVAWVIMDTLFFMAPLLYWMVYTRWPKATAIAGVVWCLWNIIYLACYTIYPSNSMESYMAWILLPLVLAGSSLQRFYLLMQAARYFFLFFFASAGFWKIYQGGVFHINQMSGILLQQHAAQLVSAPDHWYSHFIYSIIRNPSLGYGLYLAGTLLEIVFVVGFFTKRFDRWLAVGFIAFLLMDLLVMKIPYAETIPLLLPLLFGKYQEPVSDNQRIQ